MPAGTVGLEVFQQLRRPHLAKTAMRARLISALAVGVIGLLAILAGGPIFAALMIGIGLVGFREFLHLIRLLPGNAIVPPTGYASVVLLGLASFGGWPAPLVTALFAATVMVPLPLLFRHAGESGLVEGWALAAAASLYLALPVYAAIGLRAETGVISNGGLTNLAGLAAGNWPAQPRGLTWMLLAVIVTWTADSLGFLVGRRFGSRPLAPRISPHKTLEGALGGAFGGAIAAVLVASVGGLGIGLAASLGIGVLLAVVGQVGDVSESLLKRQAGAKDSGVLIPGHGGILDRVDALLVVLPTAWVLAWLIDGTGGP